MPITMMFFMVIGMVTITAVGVTTTSDRMADRAGQKAGADLLAQSAVNEIYDQSVRLLASGKTPTSLSSRPMSTNFDGQNRSTGTYSATILVLNANTTSPAPGYGSSATKTDYEIVVRGTGVAPNGTTSIIEASFTASTVTSGTPGISGGSSVAVYPGAIQSNTTVELMTSQGIRTIDDAAVDKEAHVLANQGISWTPTNMTKPDYWAPNLIDIQGHALVPDQPSTQPLAFTVGVSGLGNPNGSKNYQTVGAHVNKTNAYTAIQNEITAMGQPKSFPDPIQWNNLFTSAQLRVNNSAAKTNFNSSLSANTITPRTSDGWRVIKAPAIINGNLSIPNGTNLRLLPSTDPNENIVYVNGNISNLGELYNLGVTVMFTGTYSDSSTAQYRVDEVGSTWPNLEVAYQNSALISSAFQKNAISMATEVSPRLGLVYAANGGINISGHLDTNGTLVSAGRNRDQLQSNPQYAALVGQKLLNSTVEIGGGVKISPRNGSEFTLRYVRESQDYMMPGSTANGVVLLAPLSASRVQNWNKIK